MIRNDKPFILVSNDDGIMSKGISSLIKFIRPLGEIVVMAPDAPRSGASSSLTIKEPLHYQLIRRNVGLTIYRCSGTPADCVKLALDQVCPRKPDLLLAGINHGDNSATNVYNSGTMGAVMEGCLSGLNAVAFSLCNHDMDADFEPTALLIRAITKWVLHNKLPELTCLNVNFPNVSKFEGIKVCKMARGYWQHEFEPCPRRDDKHFFWLGGEFIEKVSGDNNLSDRWALAHNYVAITPTKLDVTDYEYMDKLQYEMNQL